MNVEEEEWIGQTLIDFERKRCVSKVLSIDKTNVAGKNDNFGSDLYRLKMKVVLNSGDVTERSIIYKFIPESQIRRQMTKAAGTFVKETKMFREILPEMERIRQTYEKDGEVLWPECYGIKRLSEGLLIEDLCAQGLKMADRSELLDFEHSALVIRSLAKYHALSTVLIERGDVNISEYVDFPLFKNPDMVRGWIFGSLQHIVQMITQKWQWNDYAEKLQKVGEKIVQQLVEGASNPNGKFQCITHGDCWTNNILFRYGDDGKPISLKFIDFQQSLCRSPCLDLHYFMQTSLNYEVRSQRKQELIQLYYDSLVKYLKLFGLVGQPPTFDDIMEDYKALYPYAFAVGFGSMPLFVTKNAEEVDMEQISKDIMEGKSFGIDIASHVDDKLKNLLSHVFMEAEENGIFN